MAAARTLNPAEKFDWLRLIRTQNVGPIAFFQLLARYGSAAAALDALPEIARRAGSTLVPFSKAGALQELGALERAGARLVAWGEPDYPPLLAATEGAPPLLALRGEAALLRRPAVAIVGARNASANGRRFARDLALQLGGRGLVVVSGFARGIDTAAHQGALPTGTIAVLAGGIDVIYPEENRELYALIAERGALIAEMPVGTELNPRLFPRRNRIISGAALGVVVVEAALRSGSLITARYALEQGRELFAVPGSPLDPRCRGSNDLIRKGAKLTESADDVLAEIEAHLLRPAPAPAPPGIEPAPPPPGPAELAAATRRVLEHLSPSPVPVDELIRQCGLPPAVVSSSLLDLELAGRIERQAGNLVALV
jgi:DNA processing protein